MRIAFDWDPAKAASNAQKHGVTFQAAMPVFHDAFARSILDPDSSSGEERWITLGEGATGNLLVVVHTWSEVAADLIAVRVISARRPTASEARQYRENPAP
jgi:uncharacterized protein